MDFALGHDTAFPLPQSPGFAATMRALGRDHRIIAHHGRATGQAVMLRVPRLGWMLSQGPVWDAPPSADDQAAMWHELRRAGLRLVNPPPLCAPLNRTDRALRRNGFARIMTGATLARLTLRSDWRAQAHGKWRNRLVRSQTLMQEAKQRITLMRFDPARHEWLLQNCQAQARARRYRDWPDHFTRAFLHSNPRDAWIVQATQRTTPTPIAGMLFLRHGAGSSYHLGWSNEAGRASQAHRAMLARAADHLADNGTAWIDLGTVDTDANPGLARFKLGSGAQPLVQAGSWLRLPGASALAALRHRC